MVELGGNVHDLYLPVPPSTTAARAPPPLPCEQSRPSSVPAARRIPPGLVHVSSPFLCARYHPSFVLAAYRLPPGLGHNCPAPGQHDAKSAAGPAAAAAAAAEATTVAMAATRVTVVAAAEAAAAAMMTAAEAMTTAVVAAHTTALGPRGSQTSPETTAAAAVVSVAENTHLAPQAVAIQMAFSRAPSLRRWCKTCNHLGAEPCISLVRGCYRSSSGSMAAPWASTSPFSSRGGNPASRTGAAAQAVLCRRISGTAKACPVCP